MSAKPMSPLKRRILAAIAAGPACLLAATIVSVPTEAKAAGEQTKKPVTLSTSIPTDVVPQPHQWWANGWRHPWGNWNNWHNWPNWNNWHNWSNW